MKQLRFVLSLLNEVENSLTSLLQGLEGDVSKARVATNNIEVEKVMEMPLKNGELNLFSESSGDLEEDTKFFIYNVNKNNKKGFAITCNDLRLGQVLAFIEEGEFKSDISDNQFLQLIVSRIEAYVEDTKKKWQELREEHPTIRSIYEGHKEKDAYKYENWKKLNEGGNPLLTTAWDQEYPFNEVVTEVQGCQCATGCSSVALAQVFAYHRHFKRHWYKRSYDSYVDSIRNKVADLRHWDGSFNWDEMTNEKYKGVSKLPRDTALKIGALMSIIGRMGRASYGEETSMATNYMAYCCHWFGYWQYTPWERSRGHIGFNYYNFENLRLSIDKKLPVILRGDYTEITTTHWFLWWSWKTYSYKDGHAWVADGYAILRCLATNNATLETEVMEEKYVHCNPGWGTGTIGYYINNLFALGSGPIVKDRDIHSMSTNSEEDYYRYNVWMLDHVKPYYY